MNTQDFNSRKVNAQIRDICKRAGWNVYSTYTDSRKNNVRVKFAAGGWSVPPAMQNKISKKVDALLSSFELKSQWITCNRGGYGTYDALIYVREK